MTTFKYYSVQRAYNDTYFQYPKVFVYGERYKNLSEGAKIAYMLLKNELNSAIKMKQYDSEGFIYFEMTTKYLAILMNCSERKVIRVKKELEEYSLLKQVQMGFNKKTGKNNPNRLYLAELDVTERDVYFMNKNAETLDNSGSDKMAGWSGESENAETLGNSGSDKMTGCQKNAETLDNSGSDKMAANVYNTKSLDTTRYLTDTEKESVQDQLLLEDFTLLMQDSSIDTFVPERSLKLIQAFSPTFAQAQDTVRAIHNAKAKAQQQTNATFVFEELEQLYDIPIETKLYTTLLKAYQKQKTETVENMVNLIFVYCRNLFIDVLHDKAAADQTLFREKNQEQK